MELAITVFLFVLGIYTAVGFLFGIYFILKGARIDPLLAASKKSVRLLLFPGVMVTWPFLIFKLFTSKTS